MEFLSPQKPQVTPRSRRKSKKERTCSGPSKINSGVGKGRGGEEVRWAVICIDKASLKPRVWGPHLDKVMAALGQVRLMLELACDIQRLHQ